MALFNYECDEVKHIIDEVSPNYPQLTTYEKEWLYFYKYGYIPGIPVDLEYETVTVNPYGMVTNAIPYNYKSAILKGKSIKNYKNNLFDNVLEKGAISISTGEPNETNLRCYRSANFIPINGTFKIAKYGVGGDLHVCFYDSNKSFISGKTYVLRNVLEGNATVTPPTNSSFIKFYNPYDNNEPTGEYGFGVVAENEMIELEIQSVKMPVFTTTGKNLIDNTSWESGRIDNTTGEASDNISFMRYKKYIQVKPSTTYVWKNDISSEYKAIYEYGASKEYIGLNGGGATSNQAVKFTTSSTTNFIKIWVKNTTVSSTNQIEESKSATDYEPYQSNILTVNEEVELRGVGDVKDDLNLLTGKLTQRIGEIVLDGSADETWSKWIAEADMIVWTLPKSFANLGSHPICDRYKVTGTTYGKTEETLAVNTDNERHIQIRLFKTTARDINELKTYLQSNPITIQYQLETPTVKTVDLTKLNKPFEGTNNYYISSNIPCEAILEVPVVSTGKQTLQEINNY